MDSPDFECLTSAEKLNDQNYRNSIYRAYPNEPTCACPANPSLKGKTKKRMQEQESEPVQQSNCRSGCTNRCCSSVRQRKDANDSGTKRGQFMPTHCAPGTKNDEVYSGAGGRVAARMRGGGSGDLGLFNGDVDFTWYNSRFTMPSRLEGGGGGGGETYPSIGCGKERKGKENFQANEDFLQWDSINPAFLAVNKCKLRNNDEKNKPMCACPERDHLEGVLRKKGHGMCTKKPCLGTDCLIKAFKDAQEFVDSIGKGPGLAGLGIVESPYFGRPQEPREIKKSESKAISVNKVPEITSQLCNTQNLENLRRLSHNVATNVFSTSMPKKPGVVQEGLTTFPDQSTFASLKPKKKDEKIEKPKETENNPQPNANPEETPCGEPKCKSRLKKVNTEDGENDPDKANTNDRTAAQKLNAKNLGKSKSLGPPKGKSKKEDQFVYSFGNSYPASVYGHKDCNLIRPRVPAHMGWMWNQEDTIGKLKPRSGWRPGAISVQLRDMLNEAKEGFLREPRPRSAPAKGKKGNLKKTMSLTGKKTMEDEEEEEVEFPPTLHIHRKDGVYYVTMYPIRQETSEVPRLDEPVNPLQFKIVKSKGSIASSSTASDMEIEFSPPAAVNRPKKKPNVIHVETQVQQQEILDAFKRDSKKGSKPKKGKK